jgi:hypothetical protein
MALADTIARIAERSGGVPLCGGDRALAVVKTLKRLTQAFRTTIIVGTRDEKNHPHLQTHLPYPRRQNLRRSG